MYLDPLEWSREQVRAWLQFTMKQFKIQLTQDIEHVFDEDGKQLSRLNEIDFVNRIPEVNLNCKFDTHIFCCFFINTM